MATRVKDASKTAERNGTEEGDGTPQGVEPVSIMQLHKKTMKVKVRGISSLIVHRFGKKATDQIEAKQQKKAKKPREAKDPEAEYQECFYRDEDDYVFPCSAFKKAMVSAATSIDDKTNFPKTKIRQAVFVKGDFVRLEYGKEPRMRTDPVRLPSGGADMRYRPEFEDWSVVLIIEYNASVLSAEQIVNLINIAGFGVGIGDWRPEKDGEHGRFEVAN